MVLISSSSSSAHCIDGYVNRRQHLGMQTNFLPFAVNTRIFTFSWGKNENNSVHNKMVAVAETKQQRKLPHHLAKKHPFWPKGQAFWPKPVASAAAHTDISAGGKERRKKTKIIIPLNKKLVIGISNEKPAHFQPELHTFIYIFVGRKTRFWPTDSTWGTQHTCDIRSAAVPG